MTARIRSRRESAPATILVGRNSVLGTRWSAGGRLTRATAASTIGDARGGVHRQRQSESAASVSGSARAVLATDQSSVQHALYVQDEIRLTRWLIVNGGLRYDRYEAFQRVTPRVALIAMPSTNQSFKYLYGRAFRAPERV